MPPAPSAPTNAQPAAPPPLRTLKYKDKGPDVGALKADLLRLKMDPKNSLDPRNLTFDSHMRTVVKNYQSHMLLLPDGFATPYLQDLAAGRVLPMSVPERTKLLVDQVGEQAEHMVHKTHFQQPREIAEAPYLPATHWKTSKSGLLFIMGAEASASNFYVPAGKGSGITAGIGYDLGHRDWHHVERHLQRAKLALDETRKKLWMDAVAQKGKGYEAYKKFARDNGTKEILNAQESWNLFVAMIADYEQMVFDTWKTTPVTQYQFDALVSHTFNAGKAHMEDGAHAMRKSGAVAALKELSKSVYSRDPKTKELLALGGLVGRRAQEYALFLYGDYGPLPAQAHKPFMTAA